MAVIDHSVSTTSGIFARTGQMLSRWLEGYIRVRSRAQEVEYYNALSDAELAAKGLRRDDIALHVFRDSFC